MFTGAPELIQSLRAAGCEIGIVSSNDREIIADVLKHAGAEVDFIHAASRFFGKARAIRSALNMYDISRERAVYIGDELRDIEACKTAGIDMIAVGWGFNASDALRAAGARVVATPQELLDILTSAQ
jgi:phosphoglycolate phosphatase